MTDIPLLVNFYIEKIAKRLGKSIEMVPAGVMDALQNYHWPGNIRELKSAFEFAVVSCRGGMIGPEHLPRTIFEVEPPADLPNDAADLDTIKKHRLIHALEACHGNQSEAARRLGISRTSVWNQMKRFGLRG